MKVLNYLHSNSSEAFDKEKWLVLGAGYCFWKSIGCVRCNIDCRVRGSTVLVIALSGRGVLPKILVPLFIPLYLDLLRINSNPFSFWYQRRVTCLHRLVFMQQISKRIFFFSFLRAKSFPNPLHFGSLSLPLTYVRLSKRGKKPMRGSEAVFLTSSKSMTDDVTCILDGSYLPGNCTDIILITSAQDT